MGCCLNVLNCIDDDIESYDKGKKEINQQTNDSKKNIISKAQNEPNNIITEETNTNQTERKKECLNTNADNNNQPTVGKTRKIKTSDNIIFEVPTDILYKAKLISSLLEDYDESETIILNEVDSRNFERIIEYLKHYKDMEPKEIPKPFPERTDDEFLRSLLNDDWTFDFLQKLSIEEAMNLVNASNYLQIEGLINILAAKLAHEMCNCEVEEARKKFGIECDMTEEEVAEYDRYPLD